jgi:hypothetical protein
MLPYDEKAYCVVQDDDGGYALAGYASVWDEFYSQFFRRVCLVKTDSNGNMQWNVTYGGHTEQSNDVAYSICRNHYPADDAYILAGYTSVSGNQDFYVIGTGWGEAAFGGPDDDVAYSVVQTSDGGYALGGNTLSYGAGKTDFWLVKTDEYLDALWNTTYGGVEHDLAYSMVHTNDGGYAFVGETNSSGGGDFCSVLVKADSNGNMQWNRTYGDPSWAGSFTQTIDGGYALVGNLLVKTDAEGRQQWSRALSAEGRPESVIQTADGGYVIAGHHFSESWLVKTDIEMGLRTARVTDDNIVLYRGKTDPYWNYVRVRIWAVQEPTWIFGDINQDGVVDAKDLAIVGKNYGMTFSLLSLGGILGILGVQTYKARNRSE